MIRTRIKYSFLVVIYLATFLQLAAQEGSLPYFIGEERIKEIATMLPNEPKGFGDPIEQRRTWDSLYQTGKFNKLIRDADSLSALPFPKLTEQIYMSFFGGKDSETSKRFVMKRRMWLTTLVWAECLTYKGKYLPAVLAGLTDILNTTSWAFPAEDRELTNYKGELFTIALSSSSYANDMAQALYLMQSKLPAEMKQQIGESLNKKIFEPTRNAIANNNAKKEFISLRDVGNHNSVTLANVTGAALAVLKDKQQRAFFVAMAEQYIQNFVKGYEDDGYCTEGMNYYTYGFGHFVFLRESIWQSTAGKIDLFNNPKVDKMARYAPAMEIINGMYPTIGDCEQNIKPGPQLMYYLNKYFTLGLSDYDDVPAQVYQPSLSYTMYFFPNSASGRSSGSNGSKSKLALRNYFQSAGVLTVRPAAGSSMNIGATFKGGHNAEQHNHNDLGSYTIVVGDELLTGDPGLRTYTPTYFGKQRYELHITPTSYGHNVPLVNGVQQKVGKEAQAKISSTDFTDTKDVIKMDFSSAYPVPGLKKLVRTFTYNRNAKENIQVADAFELDSAGTFETALITRYPWKIISNKLRGSADGKWKMRAVTLEIQGKNNTLQVMINSLSENLTITDEVIDEGPTPFTRIALKQSGVKDGFILLVFKKK